MYQNKKIMEIAISHSASSIKACRANKGIIGIIKRIFSKGGDAYRV